MKERYRELCSRESAIPVFYQAWWLDAVAEDSWDVVLVEKDGALQAAMPFVKKRKYGFTIICQPELTQHLGPWIRPSSAKHAKKLSREKDLMQQLIAMLPPYAHFHQNWRFNISNWLPFFWCGFTQTTRYTYRLDDLSDLDGIWSGFQSNIRTDIKKASGAEALAVVDDLPLSDFLDLNELVFKRQGKKMPYTREFVETLDKHAAANSCRKCFIAVDSSGRRHAGVYIVWDSESAYYLMGGGDPMLRNSGATSLCMWEAIRFAATVTKSFDFEGSMIEPVERFFRAFGARQVAYHSVSHTPSRLLRAAFCGRTLL